MRILFCIRLSFLFQNTYTIQWQHSSGESSNLSNCFVWLEEKKNILSLSFSGAVSDAQTLDVQKGAALFRKTCIGCHDAGGNIIQPVSLHLSVNLIYSFIPQSLFLILIPLFPLLSRVQHSLLEIYRGNRVLSQSNVLIETCIWTRTSF